MEWQAADEAAMVALGRERGEVARAGEVVALVGGLGAGKTHWVKGFAVGLGYEGEVTSPTFGLGHEYRGGRLPVFHLDWYRLRSEEELLGLGWDEIFDGGGVVVVEWADLFPRMMPEWAEWLRIERLEGGGRRLISGGCG